ncbi:hypothetical protein K9M79_01020 [Candidatus Woesearchaeota archaeon]|nr:hypothetical protein [Candidatus Woesearchaeota archaeon]
MVRIKRKLSSDKIIVAAVISVLIFILGISLGVILTNERVNWLDEVNKEQEVAYQSVQLQAYFLSSILNNNASCSVLHATLEDTIADLDYSLDKLVEYDKDSRIKKDEFDLLKRRYTLDNIKYWLMAKQAKDICEKDLVLVLYFYSGENCSICPDQGVILTYFKKKLNDKLLVFPIDVDMADDEPMIKLIQKAYKIYQYPTLIIDGIKYEGVTQKNDLGNIICSDIESDSACTDYWMDVMSEAENETG